MKNVPVHGFRGTDRFQVLRELGSGGMGTVYEALDREQQARIALKTLKAAEPAAIYRFKQEFRVVADLDHPNLVRLFELFSEGEGWFFTMERVDGVELLQHVWGGERAAERSFTAPAAGLSEEQLARLRRALVQLHRGLTALHRAGKLHRDLKPANILVEAGGRVVILDLGLAVELGGPTYLADTEVGIAGTIAYMAPEQLVGQGLSDATDWFAVGVLLFEALTGRKPYGEDPADILRSLRETDGPAPSTTGVAVPADLDALCRDLLRLDPAERPAEGEIGERLAAGAPRSSSADETMAAVAGDLGAGSVDEELFLGRDRELNELDDALRSTVEGPSVIVRLHGRSGSGKSMLANRFLTQVAERPDAVILAGRCYETESVPYKGLDSLVDALTRFLRGLGDEEVDAYLPRDVHALARVFPVLRRVESLQRLPDRSQDIPDRRELRRRSFEALRELLARLGDRKRLVLYIDDLHWGDVDSASLLTEMVRGDQPPRLLLICCYRSEFVGKSRCLELLLGPEGFARSTASQHEVEVGPLAEDDAQELAASLLGAALGEAQAQPAEIAREAAGNPYFIYELARDALDTGAGGASDSRGVSLDDVLWRRSTRLPPEASDLLHTVCVAGQPLGQVHAFDAAEVGEERLAALSTLRAQRLVSGAEGGSITPYHDRVRESVVARLGAEELQRRHAGLARTMESAGSYDPEAVAVHFRGAGEARKAGHYFGNAADGAAEALAFDRAARLYREALELGAPGEDEERSLRIRMGDALSNAGRGGAAAREYLAALDESDPELALRLQRRAAFQFCVSGHVDEGQKALDDLLARLGMRRPRTMAGTIASLLFQRARLRVRGLRFRERPTDAVPSSTLARIDATWTASAGMSMFDIIAGATFQTRNLVFALRAGEPFRIARGIAWEAAHNSNDGGKGWKRTEKLVRQARTLADRIDHPQARAMATLAEGISEFTMGRWKSAVPRLESAVESFRTECTGVAWEIDTAHAFLLWGLIYSGEFADMSQRTRVLLDEARERGDLYASTNMGTFMVPHALLAADDPRGAARELEDHARQWSFRGFHLQHLTALMSRSFIDLYQEKGESAWERLSGSWSALRASQLLRVQVLDIFMHHIRARCALAAATQRGEAPELIRSAARDARKIDSLKMAWGAGLAKMVHASVAAHQGREEEAARDFFEAARALQEASMTSFSAAALRRFGEMVGGEQGRAAIASADESLAARGARDPERMAALHIPRLPARALAS